MSISSTRQRRPNPIASSDPRNEGVRRLVWSALTLASSAIAALLARKASAAIWKQAFNEDPPE